LLIGSKPCAAFSQLGPVGGNGLQQPPDWKL
jgi:hypothetical protein